MGLNMTLAGLEHGWKDNNSLTQLYKVNPIDKISPSHIATIVKS